MTLNTPKNTLFAAMGATLLTLIATPMTAQAIVLVDNRSPNLVGFLSSDFDDDFQGEFANGLDFGTTVDITQILWRGVYEPSNTRTPFTDAFSVRLFNAGEIDPFATLESGNLSYTVESVQEHEGHEIYEVYNYTLTLTNPFRLNAGSYLLSIMNNTNADPDDNWFWVRTDTGGGVFRYDRQDPWDSGLMFAGGLSFAIEGNIVTNGGITEIPTPALLPGLIGLGISVWRKRKADT